MFGRLALPICILALTISSARSVCPYDANCLNNPITGRSPAGIQRAPIGTPFGMYSPNQVNPEFGANPLRSGAISNPYAPAPKSAGNSGAVASPLLGGLSSGVSSSDPGLQGVDPDLRK